MGLDSWELNKKTWNLQRFFCCRMKFSFWVPKPDRKILVNVFLTQIYGFCWARKKTHSCLSKPPHGHKILKNVSSIRSNKALFSTWINWKMLLENRMYLDSFEQTFLRINLVDISFTPVLYLLFSYSKHNVCYENQKTNRIKLICCCFDIFRKTIPTRFS